MILRGSEPVLLRNPIFWNFPGGPGPPVPLLDPHMQCVSGLCGGSASGKTTVARRIIEQLDVPWVSLLSQDSFYKVSSYS